MICLQEQVVSQNVLKGNNGKNVIKEYKGKAMYHAVYKVFNEKLSYEITEEYQR